MQCILRLVFQGLVSVFSVNTVYILPCAEDNCNVVLFEIYRTYNFLQSDHRIPILIISVIKSAKTVEDTIHEFFRKIVNDENVMS